MPDRFGHFTQFIQHVLVCRLSLRQRLGHPSLGFGQLPGCLRALHPEDAGQREADEGHHDDRNTKNLARCRHDLPLIAFEPEPGGPIVAGVAELFQDAGSSRRRITTAQQLAVIRRA